MSFTVLLVLATIILPNFTGDSDGHLQGSLECAEESLELSTVRTFAERVLLSDEQFVQTDGDMSVVSYEAVHALNQREGGWESPATRVFGQHMKVYGELTEHEEVVFHSNAVDQRDELADPTALHLPSRTRTHQGGGKPARPPRAGSS